MKTVNLALAVALLLPLAATAQEGFYVGLGYGAVKYDIKASDWDSDTGSVDDSDTGYKVFLGYQPSRFIGFEAAYVDLGETTFSEPDSDRFGEDEPTTTSVSMLGRLPVMDAVSLHGRLGAHRWKSRVSSEDGRESDSATDLMYGFGATVHPWQRRLGLVIEWERYTEILGTDVDLFSVSGRFNF